MRVTKNIFSATRLLTQVIIIAGIIYPLVALGLTYLIAPGTRYAGLTFDAKGHVIPAPPSQVQRPVMCIKNAPCPTHNISPTSHYWQQMINARLEALQKQKPDYAPSAFELMPSSSDQ